MEFSRCGVAALLSATLLIGSATALRAEPRDLKDLDGSVFERLRLKSSEHVDVTLDGSVLKMAAGFLDSSDDEDAAKIKKLVGGLRSVVVRNFEFKRPGDYSQSDIDAIRGQMKTSEWTRIVDAHSKGDGGNAEVYILPGKDKPQGLFIIASEPTQLTVVQILGTVDLKDLGSLEDIGVPDLSKSLSSKGGK